MKTKLLRKAMLPSMFMMLAGIVSLTSSTFAWFTTSNVATVEEINVNVQAAGGLQIAAASDTQFAWSQNLSNPLNEGAKLRPASTALAFGSPDAKGRPVLSFFEVKKPQETKAGDVSSYYLNNIVAATHTGVASDYQPYVYFDIALSNTGIKPVEIHLEGSSFSGSEKSEKAVRMVLVPTAGITYSSSLNGTSSWAWETTNKKFYNNLFSAESYNAIKGTDTAADVMYEQHHGDKYTLVSSRPGDLSSCFTWRETSGFSAYKIEDDFVKLDTEAAAVKFNSGTTIYTYDSSKADSLKFTAVTSFDPSQPSGTYWEQIPATLYTKTAATYTDDKITSDVFQTVTTDAKDTQDGSVVLCEVDAQKVIMVRVILWIEGQDAQCINDIASYAFKLNLQFEAVEVAD